MENIWRCFCDRTLNIFASKTFHSIQHCFYKTNIFHISLSLNSLFLLCSDCSKCARFLKAALCQQENSFFFAKLLFLTLKSSKSKGSFTIALKFSTKQINWIRKKSLSAIFKVINVKVDLRILSRMLWSCRAVFMIWMQLLVFANALFWASGDNLGLKGPASSSKQLAFAAGVQGKLKLCRALKVAWGP